MSRHSFDPDVAADVGLNAAVLYQNIVWWCEKNAANNKHIHDGRAWTYNSIKAFEELFSYLTGNQIRRALEKLEEEGYIASGNFNQSAYDRTKWYCLLDKTHLAKNANEFGKEAQPIPDSKPDSKPDRKRDTKVSPKKTDNSFEEWWSLCPRKVGKGAARTAFNKALKKTDKATLFSAMTDYAKLREGEDVAYTVHPATWLNQERWTDDICKEKEGKSHGVSHKPTGAEIAARVAARFANDPRFARVDSGQDTDTSQPLLPARPSNGRDRDGDRRLGEATGRLLGRPN